MESEPAPAVESDDEATKLRAKARLNLLSILSGEVPISMYLEFLCRSNRTDLLLLTNMKKVHLRRSVCSCCLDVRLLTPAVLTCVSRIPPPCTALPTSSLVQSVDQRNSLTHSAIVVAHAIMSAGTTSDSFLRENLEWLSRATNWAKCAHLCKFLVAEHTIGEKSSQFAMDGHFVQSSLGCELLATDAKQDRNRCL